MKRTHQLLLLAGLSPLAVAGCVPRHGTLVRPPAPLGAEVDHVFKTQEENAEAAKYVVYAHEFQLNKKSDEGLETGWRLNDFGEDHVKQIAVNMKKGDPYPIVLERSRTSVKPCTQYEYAVHFNDELDNKRRRVVVAALNKLGVKDADERVVIAPAAAEGYSGAEAAAAYNGSLRGRQGGGFGFGGGAGGVGFGGGGVF